MQLEDKIRTLAATDATLMSFFGTGPFRWFGPRIPPGYLKIGNTCLRMKRISSVYGYTNSPPGLMNLNQPRFQFDILDFDASTTRAAAEAVINWFDTVSFAETNDFDSPPSSPPHSPNFLLNRRASEEPQIEPPGPAWVVILDYRIFNLEN